MQPINLNTHQQSNNRPPQDSSQPHMEVMPEIHGGEVIKVDPYKKISKFPKAILSIIIGLIIISGVAYGGWYGYTNYLAKPKFTTLMKKSAEKMAKLESYQMDFAINIEKINSNKNANFIAPLFGGAGLEDVIRIQGSRLVDSSDTNNPKSQGKFDISFGGPVSGFELETKTADQKTYIKILDLPTELIQFIDKDSLNNQWIDLDIDTDQKYPDVCQEFFDRWNINQVKNKLEELKNIFRQPDLIEVTQECHNDTFEEDNVVSCQFKLNSAGVQKVFDKFVTTPTDDQNMGNNMPNSDGQNEFIQFLDDIFINVYYLKNDYLVKAIVVTFDAHQVENSPIGKLFLQVKFSEFNKSQDIEPPMQSIKSNALFEGIFGQLEDSLQYSRDAKRVSDIKQIQTAFELYYMDHNEYPSATGKVVLGQGDYSCLGRDGFALQDDCRNLYIGVIPKNPTPGGMDYSYTRLSSNSYQIEFILEHKTGSLDKGVHIATENGIETIFPGSIQPIAPESTVSIDPVELADLDQESISHIKQIQTALELYYFDNNKYPGERGILGKDTMSCLGSQGWGSGNCPGTVYISKIPSSESPYVYISDNKIGYYIFFNLSDQILPYQAGLNIASPSGIQNISRYQDIDNDELPDEIETILGTNLKKADSDNDNYTDGQEIKNGYNPLGGGKLD